MNLTLIVSDHCSACNRAMKVLERIKLSNPHITTQVIYADSYEGKKVSITPALFIDQNLYCYGDIDESKLLKRLK